MRSTCGFTPLHHAIVCSQVASVELLLSLGADPTFRSLYEGLDWIRCTRGSSALHLAARKGNAEMCKLLIRAQVGGAGMMGRALACRRCTAGCLRGVLCAGMCSPGTSPAAPAGPSGSDYDNTTS